MGQSHVLHEIRTHASKVLQQFVQDRPGDPWLGQKPFIRNLPHLAIRIDPLGGPQYIKFNTIVAGGGHSYLFRWEKPKIPLEEDARADDTTEPWHPSYEDPEERRVGPLLIKWFGELFVVATVDWDIHTHVH